MGSFRRSATPFHPFVGLWIVFMRARVNQARRQEDVKLRCYSFVCEMLCQQVRRNYRVDHLKSSEPVLLAEVTPRWLSPRSSRAQRSVICDSTRSDALSLRPR